MRSGTARVIASSARNGISSALVIWKTHKSNSTILIDRETGAEYREACREISSNTLRLSITAMKAISLPRT
jgi:hypothetical protein